MLEAAVGRRATDGELAVDLGHSVALVRKLTSAAIGAAAGLTIELPAEGGRRLLGLGLVGALACLVAWRVVVLGPTVNSGLGAAFSFFNVWLRVLYRVSSIKLVPSQQSYLTLLPL